MTDKDHEHPEFSCAGAAEATTVSAYELIGAARAALAGRRYETAQALLERRLELAPDDVEALCLCALAHWRGQGDVDMARALLERARSLRPAHARVLTLSAELCLHTGQIALAWAHAEKAIAGNSRHSPAYVLLARVDAGRVDEKLLARMQQLSRAADIGAKQLRSLHNAIGRVFEAHGDFDAAFSHFAQSNRLARTVYDPRRREARLKEACAQFASSYFLERRSFGLAGTGRVFIIGMPRSGSTLLEQALAAHPECDTCGESDALCDIDISLRQKVAPASREGYFAHFRAIEAAEVCEAAKAYLAETSRQMRKLSTRRHIDKRLGNFLHAALIRLMFRDAVMLHTHRHPLDVCISCFAQDFDGHAYANDLTDLGHFYLIYQDYMRLWAKRFMGAIVHCRYETIIGDFEPEVRKIVSGLGLDWHDACIAPHLLPRLVGTASAAQVLEPVHARSIGRWRRYKKHLEPLIAALGGFEAIERLDREFA